MPEVKLETSLDILRTLDWAAETSGYFLGFGIEAFPSLTCLFEALAQVERTSLVDWRRMDTEEGEELPGQLSLNLLRLSPTRC